MHSIFLYRVLILIGHFSLYTVEITERYRGNNKNVKKGDITGNRSDNAPLLVEGFFAVVSKSPSRGPNSLDPESLPRFFFFIKAIGNNKTDLDITICIPLY